MNSGVLIAVTDHCAERFAQRVSRRRGELEPKVELAARVGEAYAAGRVSDKPPAEMSAHNARSGVIYIHDLYDRDLIFLACHDRRSGELVLITLWERERLGPARVARRYTDALSRRDLKPPG